MSSAEIGKLQALLKRVEERRAQPRLHAVPSRETSATVPDLVRVEVGGELPREPQRARVSSPAPLLTPEPFEPLTLPPVAAEPARKAPSSSPLESAMAALGDSGPLQVDLGPAATTGARLSQDVMLTHRPEGVPGEREQPFELTQPRRPLEREPTIEFETAKVRVHARELRSVGEPTATPAGSAPAALTGPSQTIEAAPLAAGAAPARSVSAARVEAPKTFGELLDQSLALRPRA